MLKRYYLKEVMMIKITNTLTGKKDIFKPIEQNKVKMYVCGVTPYDDSHIGHGRVAVVFDLLYRLLKFLDFDVTYCRNFTDIDDKLLKKAKAVLGDELRYKEIADEYIKKYTEDVNKLNCLKPDCEPRVTDHIEKIIAFVQGLVDSGHAYVSNGDVYFSIKSFSNYGRLSKHNLDDLRAGSRVQVSEKKQDPLDFVLWKGTKEETFWKSPWGYGRPGWHIECSVLANTYLGKQLDIHGGGMDLIFPHHENEIAQSESLNKKTFVNYWMHNAFVTVDKEKMSKSLGNFFILRQVFEKVDPMVVRFYFLSHSYRAPLDFSFEYLESFEKGYKRLCNVFSDVECENKLDRAAFTKYEVCNKMLAFLCDDLNTSGMLGVLFENLNEIKADKKLLCIVKVFIQDVLGLTLEPIKEKKVEITPEIQALIDERETARKEKNWARADEIRDKLKQMGVDVQDKKI